MTLADAERIAAMQQAHYGASVAEAQLAYFSAQAMNAAAPKPIPPALCLTRRDWVYHSADSHVDSSQFRARMLARLLAAQPKLREQQERQAA